MNKAVFDEVSVLWAQHLGQPFPGMGDDDVFADFVLADAYMAGIVTAYVGSRRGSLNTEQRRILANCARDLRWVLRRVRGREARAFVARSVRIADLILGRATLNARHQQ
ncbi:hypothetical protein [Microtetraspora glauca]|uniref:Uncharacterized protein n=1 Tax=Microtetraspora glauca TaxID=1996 RepID=A0ABV3GIL4_MICGL